MLKVYIAGPMTGYPDHNFPAFNEAAARWAAKGWEPVNPAELDGDPSLEGWRYFLKRDIALLMECDAIALLEGWQNSKGASLEKTVATALGIRQYDASNVGTYASHPFVPGYNACCDVPAYNHESEWWKNT
jgi:hypothetical protein